MQIRRATLIDAERIAQNNVKLADEIENMHVNYAAALSGTKTLLQNNDKGFYLVAEEEQSLIGQMMITYEWSDWRNKIIWWIHRIYVDKSWRHAGVFKQMLQELASLAAHHDVFTIRLYVLQENIDAIKIYEKMGMRLQPFLIYQYNVSG